MTQSGFFLVIEASEKGAGESPARYASKSESMPFIFSRAKPTKNEHVESFHGRRGTNVRSELVLEFVRPDLLDL